MSVMPPICPVCNGLVPLVFDCPRCGNPAGDAGRASDALGPYAPYEPGHEESRLGGPMENMICVHAVQCPSCGTAGEVAVVPWP